MAKQMGKQWKHREVLFCGVGGAGSKITADGDCSHEIKRRLLLGRQAVSNLDIMGADVHRAVQACPLHGCSL